MLTSKVKLVVAILSVLVVACQALPVRAEAISVNYGADAASNGSTSLLPTDTAGVVPVANWNNISAGANGVALKDSNGTLTGLTLTQSANGGSGSGISNFSGTGDLHMMAGSANNGWGATPVTLTFDGTVPYSTFDVYVYYHSGWVGANASQQFSIVDGSNTTIATQRGLEVFDGTFSATYPTTTSYILSNNLSDANANDSNYVKFTGLTSAQVAGGFTLKDTGLNGIAYINGMQIISIPEPGTLALFSTGLFSLLAYAWRKRK